MFFTPKHTVSALTDELRLPKPPNANASLFRASAAPKNATVNIPEAYSPSTTSHDEFGRAGSPPRRVFGSPPPRHSGGATPATAAPSPGCPI